MQQKRRNGDEASTKGDPETLGLRKATPFRQEGPAKGQAKRGKSGVSRDGHIYAATGAGIKKRKATLRKRS